MKLRSALLAATVLAAAPVAAKAQAISGLYIGAGAGANFMERQTLKGGLVSTGLTAPTAVTSFSAPSGNVRMDTGLVGVLSLGYGLGNGLRFEIEGSYRQNKFKGAGPFGMGGDEQKYGPMFNVLYDFDPAVLGLGFLPVVPYVGIGGGYQWAQQKNAHMYGTTSAFTPLAGLPSGTGFRATSDDTKGSFAAQAIGGVSFPIPAVPGLSLTAEYRYLRLLEHRDYKYTLRTGPFAGAPTGIARRASFRFEDDANHAVLLGVRYAFNAAPPPVIVAPAPAPREAARTYLVFFDWDRADLTDRARQIIAEAAQATTRVPVTRIQVNGHTDLSGGFAYNQRLSVRRATNVANELVRLGVPRQAISIQGFGKTRPLVPTADGVREPQNRRVEIILQ